MKSLNSTDAEERRQTLKQLAGPSDTQGHSEITGLAEVRVLYIIDNYSRKFLATLPNIPDQS